MLGHVSCMALRKSRSIAAHRVEGARTLLAMPDHEPLVHGRDDRLAGFCTWLAQNSQLTQQFLRKPL